jgi:hypothetical protein
MAACAVDVRLPVRAARRQVQSAIAVSFGHSSRQTLDFLFFDFSQITERANTLIRRLDL